MVECRSAPVRQPVRAAARHPEPARSYTRQGTGTHSGRAALTRLLSSALRPGSPGRAADQSGRGPRRARCTVVHVYSAGRRPTRRLVVLVVAARPLRVPVRGMVRVRERDSTRRHTSPVVKDRMRSVARHARSSGSAGWGGAAGSLTKQRRDRRRGRGAAARGRRDGPWFSSPVTPNAYQTQSDALGSLAPPALHPTSRRT